MSQCEHHTKDTQKFVNQALGWFKKYCTARVPDNVNTQIFCKMIYTCGIILSHFTIRKGNTEAIAPPLFDSKIAQRYQHFRCLGWGGEGVCYLCYTQLSSLKMIVKEFAGPTDLIKNMQQLRRGHGGLDEMRTASTMTLKIFGFWYSLLVLLTIVRRPDTREDIKSLPALAVTIVLCAPETAVREKTRKISLQKRKYIPYLFSFQIQ